MRIVLIIVSLMIFVFGAMVFVIASSGGSPVSNFEADIYGPPAALIMINVPDKIYLGNLSYDGESARIEVKINNTGNVNVTITPQLVNSSDEIFSNLYFIRRTSDSYRKMGNWSINITASDNDYFYVKLNLKNANLDINDDMIGVNADVKFVAVQA